MELKVMIENLSDIGLDDAQKKMVKTYQEDLNYDENRRTETCKRVG